MKVLPVPLEWPLCVSGGIMRTLPLLQNNLINFGDQLESFFFSLKKIYRGNNKYFNDKETFLIKNTIKELQFV